MNTRMTVEEIRSNLGLLSVAAFKAKTDEQTIRRNDQPLRQTGRTTEMILLLLSHVSEGDHVTVRAKPEKEVMRIQKQAVDWAYLLGWNAQDILRIHMQIKDTVIPNVQGDIVPVTFDDHTWKI